MHSPRMRRLRHQAGPAAVFMGWVGACGVSSVDYTGKSCASGTCPTGWVCGSPERICVRPGQAAAGTSSGSGSGNTANDGGQAADAGYGAGAGSSSGGSSGTEDGQGGKGGGGPAGGAAPRGGSTSKGGSAGTGVAGAKAAAGEGGTPGETAAAGEHGMAGDRDVAGEGGSGAEDVAPPPTGASCSPFDMTCRGESCCVSLFVPKGDFTLGGTRIEYPSHATISSFYLDKYEVTAGRFRAFVANYDTWRAEGNPAQDSGAYWRIPGSGWQSTWNDALPADAATLESNGQDCYGFPTWPQEADASLPSNCVTWFTAFAFCLWDGGRLPTQAEWEYAASGGSEGRVRPWSPSLPPPFGRYAVYGCLGDGDEGAACTPLDILSVGSRPEGAGRWGHQDLAGSMWEWALDQYTEVYPDPCRDCANVSDGSLRILRGGSWDETDMQFLDVTFSNNTIPQGAYDNVGFRCAR